MKISKDYKNLAMGAVGIAGGQIAANYAGKALDGLSFIPENIKPYAKGGVQTIAGIVIASKGKKNALVANAGLGMAASGVKNLISALIPSLGIAGVGEANDPFTYIGETADLPQPFNMASASLGSVGANENGTWS
jgi:hypothetical protein